MFCTKVARYNWRKVLTHVSQCSHRDAFTITKRQNLDQPKLKALAHDKSKVIQISKLFWVR